MDCEQAVYFSLPLVSRSCRAPREISRSPCLAYEALVMQANPGIDFLMVIMASSIGRGRIPTTATATESRKMAAILLIIITITISSNVNVIGA